MIQRGQQLIDCVRETGRKVMVCHVLRYTPFYRAIRRVIALGTIGEVINIHMMKSLKLISIFCPQTKGLQ